MPLTHLLATSIGARLTEVRKKGILDWVRPDGKTQVTVEVRREGGREGEVASREGRKRKKQGDGGGICGVPGPIEHGGSSCLWPPASSAPCLILYSP